MNLVDQIQKDFLPKHLAIIMDGNGRWAKQKGKLRVFGHENGTKAVPVIILIIIFIIIEWLGREDQFALDKLGQNWKKPLRWAMYYVIIFAVYWFTGEPQEFIYFQF